MLAKTMSESTSLNKLQFSRHPDWPIKQTQRWLEKGGAWGKKQKPMNIPAGPRLLPANPSNPRSPPETQDQITFNIGKRYSILISKLTQALL
jgi:hypothetical protein